MKVERRRKQNKIKTKNRICSSNFQFHYKSTFALEDNFTSIDNSLKMKKQHVHTDNLKDTAYLQILHTHTLLWLILVTMRTPFFRF